MSHARRKKRSEKEERAISTPASSWTFPDASWRGRKLALEGAELGSRGICVRKATRKMAIYSENYFAFL